MALDDDVMTTPPQEPDSGTPADAAEGTADPTTEGEEDSRFA